MIAIKQPIIADFKLPVEYSIPGNINEILMILILQKERNTETIL